MRFMGMIWLWTTLFLLTFRLGQWDILRIWLVPQNQAGQETREQVAPRTAPSSTSESNAELHDDDGDDDDTDDEGENEDEEDEEDECPDLPWRLETPITPENQVRVV